MGHHNSNLPKKKKNVKSKKERIRFLRKHELYNIATQPFYITNYLSPTE